MKAKRTQTKTKPKAPSQTTAHIADTVKAFRDARDWGQFHDAKNLAISLNVEAGELLELFLWKQPSEVDAQRLKEELADVFYVAFLLADAYQFDVGEIVAAKLKLNAAKYPVKKAKGSKKKYDEL
jgi:NTP pyrophosphatase (non-canonical NTP hydrolase)